MINFPFNRSWYLQTCTVVFQEGVLSTDPGPKSCHGWCCLIVMSVRHTTLEEVGLPLTTLDQVKILHHCWSSRVLSVFLKGNGRKNIVPLHAFKELYTGTLAVYIPRRSTVLALWMSWPLRASRSDNSGAIGTICKPLRTQRGGNLSFLMLKSRSDYCHTVLFN